MGKFLQENKIVLVVVVGILVVGAAVYFGLTKQGEESFLSECLAPAEVRVTKVLDGDTIIVEGGYHIRLLGLDADESGYPCYKQAKSRLEELVLNKKVRLEKDITDLDQYDRCLRYVFFDNQNVSLELVEEGLAIARFYPPDIKYQEEISQAEKQAIENEIGCKWSGSAETSVDESRSGQVQWEKLTTEKLGFDVVSACQAGKYLGRELIVEGKIADAYRDLKSNTIFLNFEKPYPNQCFTGVIFSSDLYKFVQSPEDYYLDKTFRIMGEVKEYQGRPEIILETPGQIEVGG